jgi:hypothetical protein
MRRPAASQYGSRSFAYDLAGILALQIALETNEPRHFEVGEPLAQEGADCTLVQHRAGFRLDMGAQRLAEFFVRDAEDSAVMDRGKARRAASISAG